MHWQRDFLLYGMLTAGTVALMVQTASSAERPASTTTQSPTSAPIPDLSGTWVYPFCCGFLPPLSGPGPVLNKSGRAGLSSGFAGDHTNPILKAVAADVVRRHGEIEASGVTHPTPRNQCWPEGVPFVFANFGMQLLQQPDKVTVFYEHDHQVRHVRLNQHHRAQVTPSWYGDSVGHYEGDTLVIDTVGVKIGPFSMIDWYGTPYTQTLHVVERYRLIGDEASKEAEERGATELLRLRFSAATGLAPDLNYKGKQLQLDFTVEDEGVFTVLWSATISYRRSFGEWPEHVCAENARFDAGKVAAVPTAAKPDF